MPANIDKHRISDFAVFTLAALIPALVWIYIPVVAILAILVIPVPLALLVRRQDIRYGLVALLLMWFVLSAFTGKPVLALLLVLQTGPLGLLLGLIFKNHVPSGKALLATILFALIIALEVILAASFLTDANPLVLSDTQMEEFEQRSELLHQMINQGVASGDLDPSTRQEMERVINHLAAVWPVLSLSAALIWFMVAASVTYWLTRRMMVRFGYEIPAPIPFRRWKLPWYIIWVVIAGLAFLLGGDFYGAEGLSTAGKVVLWVVGFILCVVGASVTVFFIQRWKWPFKVLAAIVMVIYLPVTLAMFVFNGVIDSIWNIRRLTPEGRTPEEEEKE